ncbi:MAG: Fic family protein [Bacteroidaceae bacterium]|nr:Fic family protein [Bacteroidaceae bacterium]
MEDYSEYLIQGEPEKRDRVRNWMAAIGLQDVDGLTPSNYMLETVRRNIEGEITIDEVGRLVDEYYTTQEGLKQEIRTLEADKVAVRIAKLLSHQTFGLGSNYLALIHRSLFEGIYKFAGTYRDYNISKKELVLRGESVRYEHAPLILPTLKYEFEQEQKFSYNTLTMEEMVKHISRFIANVWQVHPFGEGNTRTTAVFTIQYLKHLGFKVTNEVFADNSKYFRNALVRANYSNIQYGIKETTEYLERFFRNLLMGEENELKNRYMIIGTSWNVDESTQENARSTQECNKSTQEIQDATQQTTTERIVEEIRKHPFTTREQLAGVIGITPDGIKKQLDKLKKAGKIRHVGATKKGHWEIIEE